MGCQNRIFTDAKQTPIVENIVNHLKKNDMNSSALKIISQHTYTPLKRTGRHAYEFFLTDICYLPLQLKKKQWSADRCVLAFDYKCSSFISHIGIYTKSEELIIVRNIDVTSELAFFFNRLI